MIQQQAEKYDTTADRKTIQQQAKHYVRKATDKEQHPNLRGLVGTREAYRIAISRYSIYLINNSNQLYKYDENMYRKHDDETDNVQKEKMTSKIEFELISRQLCN